MNPERVRQIVSSCCILGFFLFGVLAARGVQAGDDLFTNGPLLHLRITIPPESVTALRTNSRDYVRATVRDGSNEWASVGIHLKGSTGSFRNIDGKPALTLSFEKFVPAQRFHGLRKIHLNNSVEDASYMNELIGSAMFRAAGVPAARVTHALVDLNERPLGLYVMKEGFAEEFLAQYFRHPDGNLYDLSREGHDVNEPLDKAFGKGPDDRSDLDALAEAALEPDLTRRQERLQKTLDVDRFLSFMAMEVLLGHRDGYCLARNNFRVYQDVDSARMVFFPHGMDQLFGNARASIQPMMNGIVARAWMERAENRVAFRGRCTFLFTNLLKGRGVNDLIDQTLARLQPQLSREAGTGLQREAAALKDRITARFAEVERQLQQPLVELLRFQDNVGVPNVWQPVDVPDGGRLAQLNAPDGKPALMIQAGPVTAASWRTKVLLMRGRYRFEASLRTEGVERLKFGRNHGAVIKVPGLASTRPESLLGSQAWKTLQVTFEVGEREQEVELICELRASKGTAWFDKESLRVTRME